MPPAELLAATMASVQPSNWSRSVLGHPEVVRDDHRGQWLEQLGGDVAAAVRAQPLEALDNEVPNLRLDGFHLPRGEPAGDQLAELGVYRRVLHDERRIVGQTDHVQFAVGDRQALCRREGAVVTGGGPDVGVPGQHVVVLLGVLVGHHVVHRVVVAQRGVHGPRVGPGIGICGDEPGGAVRQSRCHVLFVRHREE